MCQSYPVGTETFLKRSENEISEPNQNVLFRFRNETLFKKLNVYKTFLKRCLNVLKMSFRRFKNVVLTF